MAFRITRYEIKAPISPFRIALITDMHNIAPMGLAEAVAEAKPDAIVISGDLYNGPPRNKTFCYDKALACLSELAPIAPIFYSQGNHDKTLTDEVRSAIDRLGVHLMTDAFERFGEVVFGGLGSAYIGHKSGRPNMEFIESFVKQEGYRILICHHPEYFRAYLRPYDIPLILSGHNHGGQWALFGQGLYVPGQGLFPKHTSGVIEGRLVVSRGISNPTLVPRIGAPTELVILDLK